MHRILPLVVVAVAVVLVARGVEPSSSSSTSPAVPPHGPPPAAGSESPVPGAPPGARVGPGSALVVTEPPDVVACSTGEEAVIPGVCVAVPAPRPPTERSRRVMALADRLPFDWRDAGTRIVAGCWPYGDDCHWGTYDPAHNEIWVGHDAFADAERLRYVVAHEVAHAWQFTHDDRDARHADLAGWGYQGVDGLERAADCLATAWGASGGHYWTCPPDAVAHLARVFVAG